MANLSSIARPYAIAAFEYARDKGKLADWQSFLNAASEIAKDNTVSLLLSKPEVNAKQLLNFFEDVLAKIIDADQKNFLRLLSENKRLNALPEITDQFKANVACLEKISKIRLTTAIDLDEGFREKLSKALEKRMQREVTLQYEVDPQILGGAIIQMGDRVIDGSIRGKLTRLLEFSLR